MLSVIAYRHDSIQTFGQVFGAELWGSDVLQRDMRNDVNIFMQTVMNEAPLDASLVDFEDGQLPTT